MSISLSKISTITPSDSRDKPSTRSVSVRIPSAIQSGTRNANQFRQRSPMPRVRSVPLRIWHAYHLETQSADRMADSTMPDSRGRHSSGAVSRPMRFCPSAVARERRTSRTVAPFPTGPCADVIRERRRVLCNVIAGLGLRLALSVTEARSSISRLLTFHPR